MTGSEAWSIVAPIMAAHMHHYENNLDALEETYVLVFGALQLWDKKKKPKTNSDRVRAMSDEKLAERFADGCCRDYPCEDKYMMPDGMNCYGCWLDWLKEEAEE